MTREAITDEDMLNAVRGAARDAEERIKASDASYDQHLSFVALTDEEVAALATITDGLVSDDPVDEVLADFYPREKMMRVLADFFVMVTNARAADRVAVNTDEEVTIVSLRPGETGAAREQGLPG